MRFSKRIYRNPGELVSDFLFPWRNVRQLRRMRRSHLVSTSFRERLMIAVSAVNGCRYCSYFHAREALKAGLSPTEVRELLSGTMDHAPEDELPALLYAQHWAESRRQPDEEATRRLEDIYGGERAEAIGTTLRLIYSGNMAGNTLDYILHKISRGRLGGAARSSA